MFATSAGAPIFEECPENPDKRKTVKFYFEEHPENPDDQTSMHTLRIFVTLVVYRQSETIWLWKDEIDFAAQGESHY